MYDLNANQYTTTVCVIRSDHDIVQSELIRCRVI